MQAVKRSLEEPSFADWVRQMKQIQDAYNTAKAANDTDGMKRAAFQVDELQVSVLGVSSFACLAFESASEVLSPYPQDSWPDLLWIP